MQSSFSKNTFKLSKNQPGEPLINRIQKEFKRTQKVPLELIQELDPEATKHLIEVLISDNLNMKEQLVHDKQNSSFSEDDLARVPSVPTTNNNSYSRQPTFPHMPRPIAREDLRTRRFNNISTYHKARGSDMSPIIKESFLFPETPKTHKEKDECKEEVLKMCKEISEVKLQKSQLHQLLRLSPKVVRFASEVNKQLKQLKTRKRQASELLKESGKLKFQLELENLSASAHRASPVSNPNSSFLSSNQDLLDSLNTHPLVRADKQILHNIKEFYRSGNMKKFREFAFGLMADHEASEITTLLVKHASELEETVCLDCLKDSFKSKEIVALQETVLQKLLSDIEQVKQSINSVAQQLKVYDTNHLK